jgi:hypothetical protein
MEQGGSTCSVTESTLLLPARLFNLLSAYTTIQSFGHSWYSYSLYLLIQVFPTAEIRFELHCRVPRMSMG